LGRTGLPLAVDAVRILLDAELILELFDQLLLALTVAAQLPQEHRDGFHQRHRDLDDARLNP